jgi:hypothetical protein
MKLDILVEAFHLRAGAETSPGMDRDDPSAYRAVRVQRETRRRPQPRPSVQHRQTEISGKIAASGIATTSFFTIAV